MKTIRSLTSLLQKENKETIDNTLNNFNYSEKILFLKKKLVLLKIIKKSGCIINESLKYKINSVLRDINKKKFLGVILDKEFLRLEKKINYFFLKETKKKKKYKKLKIKKLNKKKIK